MRLGLNLGYSGSAMGMDLTLVQEADRLGFHSVWSAEAYGSDAVTPLTWVAARTERIRVGTAIMQIAGRTPVLTATTALTLDQLSGGRFLLGLGVSGSRVPEQRLYGGGRSDFRNAPGMHPARDEPTNMKNAFALTFALLVAGCSANPPADDDPSAAAAGAHSHTTVQGAVRTLCERELRRLARWKPVRCDGLRPHANQPGCRLAARARRNW